MQWFWCRGPAWQWKRENFRRFRTGGITCWRLESIGRRIGRIIGSNSTSHSVTPQIHGNDSEARKLDSVRVEAERCWTAVLCLWITVSKTELVSNAIDAFEPSIEGETATVPIETRQSYPTAWQCSATCRKTGQDIFGNAEMRGLTPPVYSLDIASSDYHLFRSMAHGLAHQHFRSYEEVKKCIASWIASKDASFFWDGIWQLPERWKNVVASRGQYFES